MRDEELGKLHRKFGKNMSVFVEALARGKQFAQAIDTTLGKVLLTDATNRLETLIEKVIKEESTPEERAEIRALRKIIDAWSMRINEYQKNQNTFNETVR